METIKINSEKEIILELNKIQNDLLILDTNSLELLNTKFKPLEKLIISNKENDLSEDMHTLIKSILAQYVYIVYYRKMLNNEIESIKINLLKNGYLKIHNWFITYLENIENSKNDISYIKETINFIFGQIRNKSAILYYNYPNYINSANSLIYNTFNYSYTTISNYFYSS